MPVIPDIFASKLGNRGLANDRPLPCYASGAYLNRMFHFIDGEWWTEDERNILRPVIDKELSSLLTNGILQPQG